MLTLYIREITIPGLIELKNLLHDTVTVLPHDEHTANLVCEGQLKARLVELPCPDSGSAAEPALTGREREVAIFLAQGLRNREIGQALGICEKTVEKHVSSILRKYRLKSRRQLLQAGRKQNI